jgi:hypothetical protein
MNSVLKRMVGTGAAALMMLCLTAVPANAATTWSVVVNYNGSGLTSITPGPGLTIISGDTIGVSTNDVTGSNPGTVQMFLGNANCTGNQVLTISPGATVHISPTQDTPYSFLKGSSCLPFDVTVSSAPSPDVPETPFVAGLIGVAGVVFIAGFFVQRRRGRARIL